MKRWFVVLMALAALPLGATAESAPQYWQLVFSYDQNSLSLPVATRIAPMTKIPRTPGLEGAPVRVAYTLDWLDAGGKNLASAQFEMPVGFRSAPIDGQPCQILFPDQGVIVVRVTGPGLSAAPAAVRLTQQNITRRTIPSLPIPPVFEQTSIQIPIEQIVTAWPRLAAPIASTKIRNTGPDGNRMVIVVMGDGYTAADLSTGAFTISTNTLVNAFLGKSPWDVAFSVANVYRIDVTSNQSGSDNDPFGTYKDTYFNSSFWVSGIERLLAIDGTGYSRAISAADTWVGAGMWDAIFILVNSTKYGGSGGGISVSSVHPSASEIILHEYGHTYAGLADEYSDPYPGYPPGDPEPNVDYDFSGPGLKWSIWVNPGTPLPTPQTGAYANVVGTFEGARYQTTGIYRPYLNCLMRALGYSFCPICKEANMQSLFGEVALADSVFPPGGSTTLVGNAPVNIGITPIPISGLTYEWRMNGQLLAFATNPTLPLKAEDMYTTLPVSAGTLTLKVTYPTTLIRQSTVTQTFNWGVKADCNGNQQADDIDFALGILHDLNQNGLPDECEGIFCCVGNTGNVDCDPLEGVDISDLTALVDHLYVSLAPLCCEAEANMDMTGAIDISDLIALVNYLYVTFTPLPTCP